MSHLVLNQFFFQTEPFLISVTFKDGIFAPIGQNGWYHNNSHRTCFDQQPVDTTSMVQTLIVAYETINDNKYRKFAIDTFYWFLGKNSLNQEVYNDLTGGCHDGFGEHSLNMNQGAESTISYLLARLSIHSKEMNFLFDNEKANPDLIF